jgi:hypothetical protein
MATIYMSPDPYYKAFEEVIDLRKFDLHKHRTAGLCLAHSNKRLFLGGMAPGTPGAKITHWRAQLKGAWLIKVGDILDGYCFGFPLCYIALLPPGNPPGHFT